MTVSYKKLWKLLIDKEMKKKELCEKANVSGFTLNKLNKGENVNVDVLIRICAALGCTMDDIMAVEPEAGQETGMERRTLKEEKDVRENQDASDGDADTAAPKQISYLQVFEDAVDKNADRTAIVDRDGERRTSYAELDLLRRKVAAKLIRSGCKPGTPVIVNIGRSREYAAAFLGIWTAGLAAVPVTPEYPEARIAFIREDCGAGPVMTESFFSDIDGFEPAGSVSVAEDSPGLVLYTSGSTGRPKGILYSAKTASESFLLRRCLMDIEGKLVCAGATTFSFWIGIFDQLVTFSLGGELHILSDSVRKDTERMAAYYLKHKITLGWLSPQILKNFRVRSPYLKRILVGGEMLSNVYSSSYEIVNCYGASEVGIITCFKLDRAYPSTPIGKALPGYTLSIVSADGSVDGTEGELCVTGSFSEGYLNLPEKTAQAFEKRSDGTVLYHLGDFVRRNADGNYVYLNRMDWMVKINGQRVETLEVETVLKQVPGVDNAAVQAFTDADGQTYLCAYYVSKTRITERQARKALEKTMPPYMIPRFFVKMERLPLNVNGKVDRPALMPPSGEEFKAEYLAPRNEKESLVCEAFTKVLRSGRTGVLDDFFSLGGDSIKVLSLATELEKACGAAVSAADILSGRTPEQIALVLGKGAPKTERKEETVFKKVPFTESQRGVYFECMEDPESTAYNIPFALLLPEGTDADRFAHAVETAAARHPALFVTVEAESGEPVMVPGDGVATVARTKAESIASAKAAFVRPFDLERGPLYRFELCDAPEGTVFLTDIHHLVFDGTSVPVLFGQIADAYAGKEISEERMTLFEAAEKERDQKESTEYKKAQSFFEERFAGTEFDIGLIPDVDPARAEKGADTVTLSAEEEIPRDAAERFARKTGVTESTLFMAAFAYALAAFSGTETGCFTTANSGRHSGELSETVGMFVKTLPLRFDIPEDGTVSGFLRDVQDVFYKTMAHDCISFGELAAGYGVNSDVSFVYQSELLSGTEIDGQKVLAEELPVNGCPSDILMMVLKTASGYRFRVHYRTERYSPAYVESFSETVAAVAKGMLTAERLNEITLVTQNQRAFVDAFNRTEMPFDPKETVNSILERAIARFPDRNALCTDGRTYTYREFDRITKNLAAYIADKGIGTDGYVAVLAPRGGAAVLAAWGAVRAGAAFQMLDPAYPAERLNYMALDSGAKLLIADKALASILDRFTGDVLYTDEISDLKDAASFIPSDTPEGAITLIYTSGTTGKPKGCVLENRNLVAFYRNHSAYMGIDENACVASYASFGFDAGVMDVLTTLMAGACLYIIPDAIRLDLGRVEAFYCENGITHGFMTTQVGRAFAEETRSKTLKAFLVGGEKLVPFRPQGSFRFINGYGPCETMAYICRHDVTDNSMIQPIGRPAGNTKLFVTDRLGRLLPPGAVGELTIAGLQVGRGYRGLKEKTDEAFVPDPFCTEPGYERMYRSGDVVRLLPQGEIEYIGRRDSQVKVRGYRVELTEIEEVVRRFEGVKDAAVVAYDDPAGGKYVAAYVAGNGPIDTDGLRAFIRKEKPDYMVPAVIMEIDAIPYTQNQKVNRRALPKPERTAAAIEPPETEAQKKVFSIVAKILGREDFGISSDLFDSGLTSIGTLKLNLELGKAFGTAVRISDIRENPTVKALAAFFGSTDTETVFAVRDDYPLMQNQTGVFMDCDRNRESTQYNIPLLLRLSGKVDTERLRVAVGKAIDAHPYLKATLVTGEGGSVRAKRNDAEKAVVERITVTALPDTKTLVRPFALTGGRLYRAEIYETGKGNYLFLDIHHILSDGTSFAILLGEIDRTYAGEEPLGELYTGFDAALGEERAAASPEYAAAEKYFETLLSGCNGECLPPKCTERERAPEAKHWSGAFEDSARIRAYCEKNGISENAFFNAVFAYTLSEFLHAEDVSYCTVYNGRNDSRLFGSVAMLVRTLPVRCMIDTKTAVKEFAGAVGRQLIDTMANDAVPFAELCTRYGLKPELFFNYQGDSFTFDTLCGEKAERIPIEDLGLKAPLSIEVFLENGIFRAEIDYRADLYTEEFISSFAGGLAKAASDFTEKAVLGEVSVLSEKEKQALDEMNATDMPFEHIPAHTLFEKQADAHPGRIAVSTAGASLTYGEFEKKANIIANSLIALGAGNGEIIGLILERSELVPVVETGIMKAGCAFLPMLPTYPDDRLDYCLTDASSRFVISTRDIIEKRTELFSGEKACRAVALEDLLAGTDAKRPEISVEQSSLAYCIYTSGSTGTPKGVMIEHHNLSNFAQTSGLCEMEERGTTVLCMASISFDMSITEMIFSLCRGKTLYIASEEQIHNPDRLLEAFTKYGVDLMMMTPSFAWSLLSMPGFDSALAQLKGAALGAEAFRPVLLNKLKSLNPDMMIMNGYGPTECTQVCSAKELVEGEAITIGKPFANMRFYVADANGNVLPRYAAGELMISGEGVCRGYVNLPEKNRAAFTDVNGARAYHSGDMVRVNGDNEVEFRGRTDNQVKLRGFRVEPDEIEAVMLQFEGIHQSKVIVRNNGTEDFLAGFFTAAKEIDLEALTAFLKTKLTYYMVPAALMQLEKIPMTQNGKLDVKALPEIRPAKRNRNKRAPKKSLEEKIIELFKSVLNTDECYPDDNFFEIGGTSLSASKVVMQLKSDGYGIEYQDIFDHQSAGELADYLESLTAPAASDTGVQTEKLPVDEESGVAELLKFNTMEHAPEVRREPLGDVLLTGATGFLGIHILKALLEQETGRIVCLIRRGRFDDVITRLKSMLVYYFEDDFAEEFGKRISVIEGDITDPDLKGILKGYPVDTIINSAACVKHYAKDDSIEFVNIHGVENLIALAKERNAKLIQISTTSIPGAHNEETYRINLKMTENRLFVVDDMNNQYVRSKYRAELKLLEAVRGGIRGKIIRVGNLMGRYSDGEFQTNMRTNAFLNGLRGFANIGKCPLSHATDPMSFSPVDCTARAVVLLAGTNDCFTAFHADSRSTFDEMKVIEAMGRCGIPITPVSDEEYYAEYNRMMADPEKNEKVSALLTSDRPDIHLVRTDNRFTANVLYRLGFSWPFIEDRYLERLIVGLDTLDFFFREE